VANPSVVIDIAAEYTGKKAFDKADKSTVNLTKSVKKLAGSLGLAFGTAAIVRFGRASVKAFAEDEKSAAALTQTLKNLSLGFANVGIEDFITKMSLSTGVADDQLRPAMQKLLQTNLDVAASQKLMGLALDISAAGFGDVVSVAGTLSQAMVGNVKGLKQFNLGITQAELSTMSFDQLLEKLTKTFKGQAAAAADTYAGKINIIKNAAGEAQESIGKGLIDALMKIGNNKDMQGLTDDILAAGQGIGYLISGIGDLIRTVGSIPGFGFEGVGKNAPMPFTLNPLAILAQKAYKDQLSEIYKLEDKRIKNALKNKWIMGATLNPTKDTILTREEAAAGMTPSQKRKIIADKKAAADAAKARADELASIKALAAAKTKTDKLAAANKAKLDKAAAVFDLQKIQIVAALKGKITDEEKTRLLLMQAIADENTDKAEALAKKLEEIQKQNAKIAADLAIVSMAKDPFATWAGSLSLALIELGKFGKTLADVPNLVPGVNYNPSQNADRNYDLKVAAVTAATAALGAPTVMPSTTEIPIPAPIVTPPTNNFPASMGGISDLYGFSLPSYLQSSIPQTPSITINIEGNVLDGDDFTEKVNDALLNAERTGMPRTPAGFLIK